MKNKFLLPFWFCSLWAFISCNPIDTPDNVPSYIKIDTLLFEPVLPEHGVNSHKISDAWVYINENLIGAFELPATIPVLAEGNHRIKVRGGIKINGISSTRTAYPGFQSWDSMINLKIGETVKINPVEKYRANINIPYITDFEVATRMDTLPQSQVIVQRITATSILDPSINQSACGGVILDGDKKVFSIRSDSAMVLPKQGAPVFLEMDYLTNMPFEVGVIAVMPNLVEGHRVMTIRANQKWNKIYVNLTPTISSQLQATAFYVWIYGDKPESLARGETYLDNIKIVY
jgi:hypothetical protein